MGYRSEGWLTRLMVQSAAREKSILLFQRRGFLFAHVAPLLLDTSSAKYSFAFLLRKCEKACIMFM